MTYLTRDAILEAEDIETEEVAVPEWGGNVLVRGLSGTQRDIWEQGLVEVEPCGNRAQRRNGGTELKREPGQHTFQALRPLHRRRGWRLACLAMMTLTLLVKSQRLRWTASSE